MAKKSTAPFIVSFGGEGYFLDQDIAKAQAWKDRTIISLDGSEISEPELITHLTSRSYDGSDRVVILDEAQKIKGDKGFKKYVEEKDAKDDTVVLVAVLRSEKLPDVWALAARKGRVLEHKKLKTWDTNNEVIRWIQSEALRLELNLDKNVPMLLFQALGGDLHNIAADMRKLQLLMSVEGRRATVTDVHVRKVMSASPTAEPFQVAEAAIERNPKRAMNLLSLVYRNMGEEAHVPLTFSLLRQVEKLLLGRSLLDKGMAEDDIASALGMHPWRCKTMFLPHVRKHSMASLISRLGDLRRLDQDVKGPALSKRTRVELAVLSLAG